MRFVNFFRVNQEAEKKDDDAVDFRIFGRRTVPNVCPAN